MNKFILLAANAAAPEGAGSSAQMLMIVAQLAVIGVLFYFMLIRPQKKQQKQMAAMLSTVAIGDSVLTTSGFYGVVIDVMDEIVIVEFGSNRNCRIPMKKSAIVEIEKPSMEKSE